MERLPDPDGTFASYTPTSEEIFRGIATRLSKTTQDVLSQGILMNAFSPPNSPAINPDGLLNLAKLSPLLAAIAEGKRHPRASEIPAILEAIFPRERVTESSPAVIREVYNTPSFLDWAQKQIPERSVEQQQFSEIAQQLYHRIVEPFRLQSSSGFINLNEVPDGSATHGILKGLGVEIRPGQERVEITPHSAIGDFLVQFCAPIQAIATGRSLPLSLKTAPLAKPMLDKVSTAVSEASIGAEQAIAQANSTPRFWDWVAQQAPARDTGVPGRR